MRKKYNLFFMKSQKIIFCTTIKNRLHHLKQTLPQNIEDNKNYCNLQFLIMDYGSDDGLEGWLRSEMKEYIEHQVIVYYKTKDQRYVVRSNRGAHRVRCPKP